MPGSRAEILGKIRLGLAKPSLEHHHGHLPEISHIRELFASAYPSDSLIEKFKTEFERVSGKLAVCNNSDLVMDTIKDLILTSCFKQVAVSEHAVCRQLCLLEKLRTEVPEVQFWGEDIDSENSFARLSLRGTLAQVQLSITGAEYLVADIGSILVTAGAQASRQISLLPSTHLVIATPDQIYPNMAELFLKIYEQYGENLPGSALTLITGPSRTADIEKVLIKGVHGPTRLLVILLANHG
jgi:L-lactate dehydrogenase complex protein LldG